MSSEANYVYLQNETHSIEGATVDKVRGWIDAGNVTFFVGAGVSSRGSSVDATSVDALHQLKGRVDRLKSHFDGGNFEHDFVQAFDLAYAPLEDDLPGEAKDHPQAPLSNRLERLGETLVSLITVLTRHFNKSFEKTSPDTHIRRFHFAGKPIGIELTPPGTPGDNPDEHVDVFAALDAVLGAARPIALSDENDSSTEWGATLVKNLHSEICSWILLYVPIEECNKRWKNKVDRAAFDEVGQTLKPIFDERVGTSLITTVDLEWLSDLLWLVMRIDLPFYPNSHELSIELGVFSQRLFPPTPILAKSAEAIDNYGQVEEYLSKRFQIGDSRGADKLSPLDVRQTDAHHVLAASLMHMTQKNVAKRSKSGDVDEEPGPAVLLTTNFDAGIERALERIMKEKVRDQPDRPNTYRVLFPILMRRIKSDPNKYEIRWVIKDRTPIINASKYSVICPAASQDGQDDLRDFFDKHKISTVPESSDLSEKITGPIIVKLHGSPLEPLDQIRRREMDCRHYVIASEYHYVGALTKRTYALLECLNRFFSLPQCNLVFMGYSLGDWNVRVALAQRVQAAEARMHERQFGEVDEGKGQDPPERLAIVRERVLGDVSLFNRLKVGTRKTEIRRVITNFAKARSIRAYLLPEISEHLVNAENGTPE